MGIVGDLESMGLLNVSTPDLRDLERVQRTYQAYCTSRQCQVDWIRANKHSRQAKARERNDNLHVPKADVSRSAKECEDCGFTLVWKELKAYGINEHRVK